MAHSVANRCHTPKAIGCEVIRDLEAFSAGRDQFDDITLICFGPMASC